MDYDVTVPHPLATRTTSERTRIRRLQKIAKDPKSHLNTAQTEKSAKHKEICSNYGHDYRTIAISLYGAWGSDSETLLSALDVIALATLPDDYTAPGMWSYRLRKTISRMLYRGIAQVYTLATTDILHKARPRIPKAYLVRPRAQTRIGIDNEGVLPSLSMPLAAAL
jgi:hypothetical protein